MTTEGRALRALSAGAALAALACAGRESLALPTAAEVRSYYAYAGALEADVDGNVAAITVVQPTDQLRRGGRVWAKVGPYVILFSGETRRLLDDFPGLAGVRAVTRVEDGPEVARALLRRGELSDVLWRRAVNVAGRARRDGTERMRLIEELIEWGESHTDFEYNPRYTSR